MDMEELEYYYVKHKNLVGIKKGMSTYSYQYGEWIRDVCIMDYIVGYDDSEEKGSPYAFGNFDLMDRIEEISIDKAIELIGLDAINSFKD